MIAEWSWLLYRTGNDHRQSNTCLDTIRLQQRDELFEYGMGTGSGSGFDLAIVRTIIEAHGWTVGVADLTGGARFEIRIDE